MLKGMVDCIFADVAQPDQSRIVGVNAESYLKNGGHAVMSIKASCIDSVAAPEVVFAKEVDTLRKLQFTPKEQVTLEPFERGHAMVTAQYRYVGINLNLFLSGLPKRSSRRHKCSICRPIVYIIYIYVVFETAHVFPGHQPRSPDRLINSQQDLRDIRK